MSGCEHLKARALAAGAALVGSVLAGCAATPATEIKVPTMSMEQAYTASRQAQSSANPAPESRIVRALVSPGRPAPVVTPPDIRMAYVYEWIDAEGNLHYPGWVAIQVEAYKWVMPDVGAVPMDGSVSRPPVAKGESAQDRKR